MNLAAYRRGLNWLAKPVGWLGWRLKRLQLHLDLLLFSTLLAAAALGASLLAISKLGDTIAGNAAVALRSIEVQRIYLGRADYAEYLPTMTRLNPGVGFALGQDGASVVLTVGDEELFPDLLMALHTLQAFKPNVAWELVEMCAKKCPDDLVARAVVKGFTQEIYKP